MATADNKTADVSQKACQKTIVLDQSCSQTNQLSLSKVKRASNLSIHFGRGIFNSCNSIELIDLDHSPKCLRINRKSKDFDRALHWLKTKFSEQLNSPPLGDSSIPVVSVNLYSSESVPADLSAVGDYRLGDRGLLHLPLDRDTLGPNFKEQIDSLKNIIRGNAL
jgi:hypothetical protein